MTDWTHTWYTNHVGAAWVLLEEAETHIEKLKQEVEHANELCIRDLKHVEQRADVAEAALAELKANLAAAEERVRELEGLKLYWKEKALALEFVTDITARLTAPKPKEDR